MKIVTRVQPSKQFSYNIHCYVTVISFAETSQRHVVHNHVIMLQHKLLLFGDLS